MFDQIRHGGTQTGQVKAQGRGEKGAQQFIAADQKDSGAPVIASLTVQQTNADLQHPLIDASARAGFILPEHFQGFVAAEVFPSIELAARRQQRG
jgi:hypothetical protein